MDGAPRFCEFASAFCADARSLNIAGWHHHSQAASGRKAAEELLAAKEIEITNLARKSVSGDTKVIAASQDQRQERGRLNSQIAEERISKYNPTPTLVPSSFPTKETLTRSLVTPHVDPGGMLGLCLCCSAVLSVNE